MNKFSKMTFAMLFAALVLSFGLSSCQKNSDTPTDPNTGDAGIVNTAYIVLNAPDQAGSLIEGSETSECGLNASTPDAYMMGKEMKDGPAKPGMNVPFMRILRELKLTKDQMVTLDSLLKDYRKCEFESRKALRTAEMVIIKAANEQRKAIMDQLKAGTITKEEARTQLKALNLATRETLKNDPDVQAALAALKACQEAFFANVRGILTEAQQVIWDKYMAKRG